MEAFGIVAALATTVQAVALIVLHLLPTGYNPVRDAVSDYGVGPHQTTTAGDSPPTAAGDHPRSPAHTKKEKSDGNHHH
jgi:hypothetical protein